MTQRGPGDQEDQAHPGLGQTKCGQMEQGTAEVGDATNPVLSIRLSQPERQWGAGVSPEDRNRAGKGLKHKLDQERLRELRVLSLQKRKLKGDLPTFWKEPGGSQSLPSNSKW